MPCTKGTRSCETLHFTSTTRNCEPTPGSLISTCCSCCRCRPAGHFRAARTLQIIDAGISPAPGSARPLSPIPPASRPLSAHAVSPPKFPPRPFPPFPLSERSQPASLWRRAPSLPPCRLRQNHHQACPSTARCISSPLFTASQLPIPHQSLATQGPAGDQGTHHAALASSQTPFPIRRL